MKILFVTSNRLGDAVLSTGLLDHLIRAHPDARVTIVCGPVAEGVFARMPNRERTITLRKRPWGRHWPPLWAAVVGTSWDMVVDIRGSVLAYLVPARRRAVFRGGRGPKIGQLGALLRLPDPPLPVSWCNEADRQRANQLLPAGRRFIALAPTANWAPKTWPADRFAETFSALSSTARFMPIVLGGPGETEAAMAGPLLRALPGAIDLVGVLSLPEVVAVLRRCALFVGNDSGLMHLAAACSIPTIGLFGPTDAATYAPAGPLSRAVVGTAMDRIAVKTVVAAASALLELSGSAGPRATDPLP
jgi:heptosyltransferase-3